MKTPHAKPSPRRQNRPVVTSAGEPQDVSPTAEREPSSGRVHGDSYGEIDARDDALAATSSTHTPPPERRPEEPSEAPLGSHERLEGDV